MGLFKKEPPEKKAYWKAFGAMMKKPNAETFAAMEEACRAWPEGWQGYLFMALAYDVACAKIPFDPEKGAAYHKLAKEAGKKAGSDWLGVFYECYEESAGNFRLKEDYYPLTKNVRRLGAAMLFNYSEGERHVVTDVALKKDDAFWKELLIHAGEGIPTKGGLFSSLPADVVEANHHAEPFIRYLNDYVNKNLEEKDQLKAADKVYKQYNAFVKTGRDEVTTQTEDMYGYMLGYSLMIGGGPYQILNGRQGFYQDIRINGWITLWKSAYRGNMPALHLLAQLFHTECAELIDFAFSKSYSNVGNAHEEAYYELVLMLEAAAKNRDEDADRILADLVRK